MALLPALWACLPALPATSTSSIDLQHGGQDGGAPRAAYVFKHCCDFPAGNSFCGAGGFVAPPGRVARLVWAERERRRGVVPPQLRAGSDTEREHRTLLRAAVPSPEGRASVLALPWLGAMPGGGQGVFTAPQPDRHASGARAWRCQAVPPWLRCSGEEALFFFCFVLF